MTSRRSPSKRIRAPSLLGRSPSAARSTPAFTMSSLNLIIAVINASLGISPASDAFVALRITMKRMRLLRRLGRDRFPAFMTTSIVPSVNRHGRTKIFSRVSPGAGRGLETAANTVFLKGDGGDTARLAGQDAFDKADTE